jgi:hypothetical protein
MKERRAEPRLWCSDLIQVRVEDAEPGNLTANLEDISPSGACLQFEEPVPPGARLCLMLGRQKFHGLVIYCNRNEIGYFAGVQFDAGRKWSRRIYAPKHLTDPKAVPARGRGPGRGRADA